MNIIMNRNHMVPFNGQEMKLFEQFDEQALQWILENKSLKKETIKEIRKFIRKCPNGYNTSTYKQITGRQYSKGLQSMKGDVKRTITHKYYHDIDMVNCQPTLMEQYCRNNQIPCKYLTNYVNNRDELMSQMPITRDKAKTLVLMTIYGDNITFNKPAPKWLKKLGKYMPTVHKAVANLNRDINKDANKVYAEIANVLENRILMKIVEFFQNEEWIVGVLCFDGCMVERCDKPITCELLEECEDYVLAETGYKIQLKEKEMTNELNVPKRFLGNHVGNFSPERCEFIFENQNDETIDYMNEFFKFVNDKSPYVLEERVISGVFETVQRTVNVFKRDCLLNQNFEMTDEETEKVQKIKMVDYYLTHKHRNNFFKSKFEPRPSKMDYKIYNTYKGMAITREIAEQYKDSDISAIINHIKTEWCHDNEEHLKYVIGWMASKVQKPWQKVGTVISVRGEQGSGKTIIVEKFIEIFGNRHAAAVKTMDEVVGKFADISEHFVTFLDDTVWGGNRDAANVLKKLITDGKTSVERKYMDTEKNVDLFTDFIMTTNFDWIAPVEKNDRRFFVLDTKNTYSGSSSKEKKEYYKGILDVPAEAFAHYLYNYDISEFNSRMIPMTQGKKDQLIPGLETVEEWWYECLVEECIDEQQLFGKDIKGGVLYDTYIESKSVRKKIGKTMFYKKAEKFGIKSYRTSSGRYKTIPTLKESKAIFTKYVGMDMFE